MTFASLNRLFQSGKIYDKLTNLEVGFTYLAICGSGNRLILGVVDVECERAELWADSGLALLRTTGAGEGD